MYESSVDILPVSGVWIGGEGGGWDLEIGVNEILKIENTKLNVHNAFSGSMTF